MHITQNCSCQPLLGQLSGRHQSLLWARIRPFVYRSCEPIFILLVNGGFTWIPYSLSIIDEETHHLQNILKMIDPVFVFPKWMLSLDLFTDLFHVTGSDKLIQGAKAYARINHNITYSCKCSCRGYISIKSEIMSITYWGWFGIQDYKGLIG